MTMHNVDVSEIFSRSYSGIDALVNELSALLPTQGPIKDFIHHNTLHSFQGLKFGPALTEAAYFFGADLSSFDHLVGVDSPTKGRPGFVAGGIRRQRANYFDYDVDRDILPLMIKCVSIYYDQGLGMWPHPIENFGELGLWRATAELAKSSVFPLVPLNRKICRKLQEMSAAVAIDHCLTILTNDQQRSRYCLEVFLALPGWAGFVRSCELAPELLVDNRKSSLIEWLALFLVVELGFLDRNCPEAMNYRPDSGTSNDNSIATANTCSVGRSVRQQLGASIESRLTKSEWDVYWPILSQIRAACKPEAAKKASIQVITCIDDREFSVRRFIEDLDSEIETYGAPGFFGIDCLIQEGSEGELIKHCPVPVQPRHILQVFHKRRSGHRINKWEHEHPSMLRGWILTQLFGLPAGVKMMLGIISPRLVEQRRLEHREREFTLQAIVDQPTKDLHGRQIGYTVGEAALRVAGLLKAIGLTSGHASLVCIVGHGASSVNNPYFAAYDCGACSGRPGSFNAYAFCQMANDPRVREKMSEQGIWIEPNTVFIPFIHDTTADRIELIGEQELADGTKKLVDRFIEQAKVALAKNARFRCRQFDLSGAVASDTAAHDHVELRSLAWFEPRPEYNHATNIACIVGRRHLSRYLESDRAIFLQSYNPESDLDAALLTGILGAVIPVCGGINLEYFFSRVDGEVYGAGSKLPQNVSGLVGVMTGLESDLRTGLPRQMTEIHDALRLIIVVEQTSEIVLKALKQLPHLLDWVDNRWLWLVNQDPHSGLQKLYWNGIFVDLEDKHAPTI